MNVFTAVRSRGILRQMHRPLGVVPDRDKPNHAGGQAPRRWRWKAYLVDKFGDSHCLEGPR